MSNIKIMRVPRLPATTVYPHLLKIMKVHNKKVFRCAAPSFICDDPVLQRFCGSAAIPEQDKKKYNCENILGSGRIRERLIITLISFKINGAAHQNLCSIMINNMYQKGAAYRNIKKMWNRGSCRQAGILYQKLIKMSDKNCFFFPYSLLKNSYRAKAMKVFFAVNKKKTIQFFYQSF